MVTETLEAMFKELEGLVLPERGYPYDYQDLALIKLFLYGMVKDIKGFQSLQKHLQKRADVVELLGLDKIPHRKTIATRFRALSDSVRSLLHQLTEKFIKAKIVDPLIGSVDSSLMQAHGNVWHKKQRDKGELPKCGNIDIEAHWGKSGCGKWVYGYRIHCLTLCGPAGITWPADIAVEAANIKDAEVFDEQLSKHLPKKLQVLLGDGGYDQDSCYQICDDKEISLILRLKKHTSRTEKTCRALS